jgi:predicted component of type VI protein secretion system
MYRTLAPSVFHVYLHPDDYREVQPIAAAIVADAQQGLNSRVDELNARARWARLVSGKQAPIEDPPGGWEIHLHPEANGELSRGELGIESRLSIPPPPRYDGGAATTRIARTTVAGAIRRQMPDQLVPATTPPPPAPVLRSSPASSAALQASATAIASPPQPAAAHHDDTATHESALSRGDGGSASRAHLTYVDEEGTHVYAMRKDLISIGRGGSAHWVDVQLVTSTRVSREHCRIRRDDAGRFYLQDVSTWGTSVNGLRIEPFARQVDGRVEEVGHEQLLTSPARIQLADAVTIEFTLEGS